MQLSNNIHDNQELFLQQIVNEGVVYTLGNDEGFAVLGSEKFADGEVMPFWSKREFVEVHLTDDWAEYSIIEVALEGFLEEWLEGMHEDEFLVGVNWNEQLEGLEIEPMELAFKLDEMLDEIE